MQNEHTSATIVHNGPEVTMVVKCGKCSLISNWDITNREIDGDVIRTECPSCHNRNVIIFDQLGGAVIVKDSNKFAMNINTLPFASKFKIGQIWACDAYVIFLRNVDDEGTWECIVLKSTHNLYKPGAIMHFTPNALLGITQLLLEL